MSERKHLAVRGYTNGRLIIACKCRNYQPIKGTAREQEDAHRAHRVAMGETVKPRVPTMRERLEMAISRAVELENENARLTDELAELKAAAWGPDMQDRYRKRALQWGAAETLVERARAKGITQIDTDDIADALGLDEEDA
ncbi:hypothetical protein [Streptomyces sparsogenes]|uniref:Uncharacterized protein n=1 Tax=Streptomyces sparsogenes DSM 40356 TaxID=1331668 RepID=A0A1R1S848_9ACTN|nr:hypothetical protein [Streptomyces sparsogenes]OMI34464.1 hypothetical protein SPAR_36811 [Streptomyces sparsogenes DSM 40356]